MIKLRDILNEIGETTDTYEYTTKKELKLIGPADPTEGGFYTSIYEFTGDDGEVYKVNIDAFTMYDEDKNIVPNPIVEIAFKSKSTGFGSTNIGLRQAFKVIATVMKIAKTFADKYDWVDGFKFTVADPLKDSHVGKLELYKTFIKKQFPNAKIETNPQYRSPAMISALGPAPEDKFGPTIVRFR